MRRSTEEYALGESRFREREEVKRGNPFAQGGDSSEGKQEFGAENSGRDGRTERFVKMPDGTEVRLIPVRNKPDQVLVITDAGDEIISMQEAQQRYGVTP